MEETNEIEIIQEEETTEVIEKLKEVKNESKYFTDEMHKSIFPFQEAYRSGYGGGKAVRNPVKLSMKRK